MAGKNSKRKPRAVAKTQESKAVFSTNYANINGSIIDGQQIARNYRTYFRMFRINTDIRRCIIEIQQTSGKSGYEIHSVLKNGKEKVIRVMEFEQFLKNSGGFRLIKNEIVKNISIFANAFIRLTYNVRSKPIKATVLDSRYVSIVTDDQLNVIRYTYQNPASAGMIEDLAPAEIIHVKDGLIDSDNPLFAMSILETLVLDVMGDEEASLSNYYYFGNDAIPSALFILKEGLDTDQIQDVHTQIKDALQGGHNKHKTVASPAVTDVKKFDDRNDMDHEVRRRYTTERICSAYGVPRTILGYIEDVNHSNGESQYTKFIENTIRPWETILEEVFDQLLAYFQENAEFNIIDEHIDDLSQRSTLARDNVAAGLWTRNEGRRSMGYEEFESEVANQLTVPTTQQLLDNLTMGLTPPEQLTPTA